MGEQRRYLGLERVADSRRLKHAAVLKRVANRASVELSRHQLVERYHADGRADVDGVDRVLWLARAELRLVEDGEQLGAVNRLEQVGISVHFVGGNREIRAC